MGGPGFYLYGEEEKRELLDVMESGYFFRYGRENDPAFKRKVATLEKEFAEYSGVKHCVAVSSGTGAILCALAALGIGPGDEVIVPGYTFISTISSIIIMNAIPVLAEIDESLTIDPDDIVKKITPKTKAILPVHMLGNPCDMDRIMKIAREHNLYVIEDCCQATGGSYRGKKLGTYGELGTFSLNMQKTITCGDGGLVITDDDVLYERAFGFHDQGHKPRRLGTEIGHRVIVGMNFRLNELCAAVALAQLRKLPNMVDVLREKKAKLKAQLTDLKGVKFRKINDEGECATMLTLLFDTKEKAEAFAAKIGQSTLANSGWHVYNNMEQILEYKTAARSIYDILGQDVKSKRNSLPKTDDILERAVNISVGVVDKGIGAGYGINVLSDDNEIKKIAEEIKTMIDQLER